jgi:hypothetical protein
LLKLRALQVELLSLAVRQICDKMREGETVTAAGDDGLTAADEQVPSSSVSVQSSDGAVNTGVIFRSFDLDNSGRLSLAEFKVPTLSPTLIYHWGCPTTGPATVD